MPVAREVLERLRAHSTPTICNAIEEFQIRPRNEGFMGPQIRCVYPDLPPMVGHAVTATIVAEQPDARRRGPSRMDFWDYILTIPAPRVVVMQDLDLTPVGSYWGEVQANIHRALGCIGVVTNGGVRDVDEVAALDFHFFSSCLLASHAYVHLVDFGGTVTVGGLQVRPGDLLHGDKHGVTNIPGEMAPRIDEAVQAVAERERRIIDTCQAEPFELDKLKTLFR